MFTHCSNSLTTASPDNIHIITEVRITRDDANQSIETWRQMASGRIWSWGLGVLLGTVYYLHKTIYSSLTRTSRAPTYQQLQVKGQATFQKHGKWRICNIRYWNTNLQAQYIITTPVPFVEIMIALICTNTSIY